MEVQQLNQEAIAAAAKSTRKDKLTKDKALEAFKRLNELQMESMPIIMKAMESRTDQD